MQLTNQLLQHLSQTLRVAIRPADCQPVGGGSINHVYCIQAGSRRYCCKLNSATKFPHLFAAEAAGLEQLQPHIKVPHVIARFEIEDLQLLLMEWIDAGKPGEAFWKTFGEQLARLHTQSAEQFGASADNYMGAVAQSNRQHTNWNTFFAQERIRPLVTQCAEQGLLSDGDVAAFEKLSGRLPLFFEPAKPALLHGDLWNGNLLCASSGQPVLIDPAIYYGHPSVDLAMTTLFGGFNETFYKAYSYYKPLPENYRDQWSICNLYPLLIHLLLFGKSYLQPIRHTLQRYT